MNYHKYLVGNLICIIVGVVLFVCLLAMAQWAYAGERQITLTWEQEMHPDLAGWTIEHSLDNSTWEHFCDVPYEGTERAFYNSTQTLVTPEGEQVTHYFRGYARDDAGNRSDYSNVAEYTADLEAPGRMFNLTITVEVQ